MEADGSIRVVPVDFLPVKAFRGMGRRGGCSQHLFADREAESATLLHKDPEFRAIANLPQEWLG